MLSFISRHSRQPQPVDRVNKYLNQAIIARSVDREKSEHVNYITLRFKKSQKEKQVRDQRVLYIYIWASRLEFCTYHILSNKGLDDPSQMHRRVKATTIHIHKVSHYARFLSMWYVRPAKPQISLRSLIRAFASSLNIL